jgi:phosphoglycerol transferase MdoB-like AlkP superfamily enzyme
MKRTLLAAVQFFLRLFGFWLLFFAAYRLGFLIAFYEQWYGSAPTHTLASFWYAIPLDLSACGYLSAIPVLLWHIGILQQRSVQVRIEKAIVASAPVFIVVLTGILVANLFIYSEWHTLLNNRALEYLKSPQALFDSMSVPIMFLIVALFVLLVWLMWRLYKAMVGVRVFQEGVSPWGAVGLPLHSAILAILIRGGLGVMPINESAVYYSNNLFNNHAATNVPWHLLHSMVETRAGEHHYRFMADRAAAERTAVLVQSDSTLIAPPTAFLKTDSIRPNIVLIIMESMTAQVIEELNGMPGVCPNLSALIREGVLFDRCYSSGYRTDQGLISVLAGFPALPDQSIVLLEDKAVQLNSLPRVLKENGYASSFFYGGALTFANIGVWLTHQEFDFIRSGNDFPPEAHLQRWGADDDHVFKKAARELIAPKTPFFSIIMTLSLHPPFDVPYRSRWQGDTRSAQFLNSAAFADDAIGKFFQTVKNYSWYDHTLFVLVADHGNGLPGEIGNDHLRARHIPFIITGPFLNDQLRGKRISTIGGHHDIPATLLTALGITENFPWSRSLWPLNGKENRSSSAYYTNEDGIGWVVPEGAGFYSFKHKKWLVTEGRLDSRQQLDAQAWLQTLYADFLAM